MHALHVYMMMSSNANIFSVTGHLCREFTGHQWTPYTKGQWRGALTFSLICAWINGWVNNHEAGNLRCHCAHYDVTVMTYPCQAYGNELDVPVQQVVLRKTILNEVQELSCQTERLLTHWGQDKMTAIFADGFFNTFSGMKMLKFLFKFLWNIFPRVQLTISQHWFR